MRQVRQAQQQLRSNVVELHTADVAPLQLMVVRLRQQCRECAVLDAVLATFPVGEVQPVQLRQQVQAAHDGLVDALSSCSARGR